MDPIQPGATAAAALTLNQQLKGTKTLITVPASRSAAGLPTLKVVPGSKKGGRPLRKWPFEQLDEHGSCKHCGRTVATGNVSVLANHFLKPGTKCSFLTSPAAQLAALEDDQVAKALALSKSQTRLTATGPTLLGASTSTFGQGFTGMDSMSVAEQGRLGKLFAAMVIQTSLSFNWAANPAVVEFFRQLRPAFKVPTPYLIASSHLLAIYSEVFALVHLSLAQSKWFTASADGWSRTQGSQHIINFMLASYGFSFFTDMRKCEAGESVTADFMLQETLGVIKRHKVLPKLAAIVTDTPNTMKSFWEKVKSWAADNNTYFVGRFF